MRSGTTLSLYIDGTVTQGRNWPDYLYRNTGSAFSVVTPAVLTAIPADHGAQWADLNQSLGWNRVTQRMIDNRRAITIGSALIVGLALALRWALGLAGRRLFAGRR